MSRRHTIITDYKLYIAHAEEGQLGKLSSFLRKYFCRNSITIREGKINCVSLYRILTLYSIHTRIISAIDYLIHSRNTAVIDYRIHTRNTSSIDYLIHTRITADYINLCFLPNQNSLHYQIPHYRKHQTLFIPKMC